LNGRVGLVTGAGSGIGRATALILGRAGANVTVADVDEPGAHETVELIRAEGGEAEAVRCDVSKEADVQAMVAHVVDRHGRLDFAHNNAGISASGHRIDTLPEEEWDRVIGVNLKGVWLCLKHELKVMREQGSGAIVNTSSSCGLMAAHDSSPYSTSKHGVLGLTKEAAIETAALGIRVNAVCPGFVQTPMADGIPADEMARRTRARVPAQRVCTAEEVAAPVVWLLSDEASYITGEGLVIDGGLMLSIIAPPGVPH
jgi:NAD(P)-dependent dehydrogenase (short-subunit alcohol dehydrogenase family)